MSKNNFNIKRNDNKSNKVANWRLALSAALSLILIAALFVLKRGAYYIEAYFVSYLLPTVNVVCGVLFALAAVYFIICRVKRIDESKRVFSSGMILFITATLFAFTASYRMLHREQSGFFFSIALILILTAVCFIYRYYERPFFWYTAFTGVGTVLLYFGKGGLRFAGSTLSSVSVVLSFVLPIAVIVFSLILRKNGGVLKIGGKDRRIASKESAYYPLLSGAGVMLAALIFSLIFPGWFFYALLAFLAYFLVMTVVYTVRMI